MSENRGKVTPDAARRWARGELPSAEFFKRVYEEERVAAEREVDRRLRRSSRRSAREQGEAQAP